MITLILFAQLLHHDPQLNPLSCRDEVMHHRRILLLAAPLQTTRHATHNLRDTAKLLIRPRDIDYICGNATDLKNLRLISAIAEYQVRMDALSKIYPPEKP